MIATEIPSSAQRNAVSILSTVEMYFGVKEASRKMSEWHL